jgi:hypothetical protein
MHQFFEWNIDTVRQVPNAVSHCADPRGLGPSATHAGGLEWRVWFAIKEEAEKAAQT